MRYAWLALFALLVACEPPAPTPPPAPDPPPVVIGDELAGAWYGVMRSDENFFVNVTMELEADGDVFVGSATFPDEPMLTTGSVRGAPQDLVITVSDAGVTLTFTLSGEVVDDQAYSGTVPDLVGTTGRFVFGRLP